MKKSLILVALLLVGSMVMARPVSVSRAQSLVEEHFFAPAVLASPADWSELYIFNAADGHGFVIVSADDCVRPVLAYSTDGSFDVAAMPAHVAAWIDGYRREIADLVKHGAVPSAAVQALWTHPLVRSVGLPPVEHLLTTTWNQAPWYNAMCPYSADADARAVTGCVATAQAQVMKYWNHPAQGHGRHYYESAAFGPLAVDFDTLYQWDSMPDALGWGSTPTQIHAVAQLMYHVGVAVEMNYGVGSSGAYVTAYGQYNLPSSERSLREHFRYSPMLHALWKESYADHDWDSLIRNEIYHQRPVLYSGHDTTGGHAFVLDGYDTIGMFHLNWGWGGGYDGYYTTDSLSPGAGGIGGNATYTFNQSNAMLIGIQPCEGDDSVAVVNVVSADTSMGTITGNGSFPTYEDPIFVLATAKPGYRFAGWKSGINTNPITFIPNGNYSDTALFVAVGGDSIGYSGQHYTTGWQDDYSSTTEWGIRIPASLHPSLRSLTSVQMYVRPQGYYTLKVYVGSAISEATLAYSHQYDLTSVSEGWADFDLLTPVMIPNGTDLWITFRFAGHNTFPASSSFYTGVSDGTWYRLPQGWVPFDSEGTYLTWMIRARLSERLCHVSVENAGYCELRNLHGAGDYAIGETATVSVSDPYFTHWEGLATTDTAITFTVTGDTTFYAYCREVGIDDVEADPLQLTVRGRTLEATLSDPTPPMGLYDIMGRQLATASAGTLRLTLPAAGVYLLRVDGREVRKIVIL